MKKEPKAVYIIENGEYTELTYEEFCHREQICPLYADKLFLPLYGNLMEVSKRIMRNITVSGIVKSILTDAHQETAMFPTTL